MKKTYNTVKTAVTNTAKKVVNTVKSISRSIKSSVNKKTTSTKKSNPAQIPQVKSTHSSQSTTNTTKTVKKSIVPVNVNEVVQAANDAKNNAVVRALVKEYNLESKININKFNSMTSIERLNYVCSLSKGSEKNIESSEAAKNYILYSTGWEANFTLQAKYQANLLKENGEEVEMIKVNTRNEFEEACNNLPENVNNVIILTHSTGRSIMLQHGTSTEALSVNGENLKGESIGNINDLPKRNIDTLTLISCNAGHLDQAELDEGNIAETFVNTGTINKVIAYDGNVGFGYDGFFGAIKTFFTREYFPRESNNQDGFNDVIAYAQGKKRETKGKIIYYSNGTHEIIGWE